MNERPEPDLDRVRRAMRDRDEREELDERDRDEGQDESAQDDDEGDE